MLSKYQNEISHRSVQLLKHSIDIKTANEIINATADAVAACRETGVDHTVVYSDKLEKAISMPSEPYLCEYGWDLILTVRG
jgi:hypothetical protein